MNLPAPLGAAGELEFTVTDEHTITFSPAPAVLSTPSLVWFLEHAAIRTLEPPLHEGQISLGGEINVQHLAPTPAGQRVTCTARVIGGEGAALLFQVEARDEIEVIARGTHRRFVVPAAAFAKRVTRNTAS